MNDLFGRKKNPEQTDNYLLKAPVNANSQYNLDGFGEIPRLSYNNTIAQQQYDSNLYKNAYGNQSREPLLDKNINSNQNPNLYSNPEGYHTIIEDSEGKQDQNSSEKLGQGNMYAAQIQELIKMEGKSPICKALTYINLVIGFLILYLIFRS